VPDTRHLPTPLRGNPRSADSRIVRRTGAAMRRRLPRRSSPSVSSTPHAVLHPASGAAPSLAGSLPSNTADTALAMRLQQAREAERAALARELHDELGAILTAARLDVAWLEMQPAATQGAVAERLQRLRALLSEGIDFKRRVVEDLHPTLLTHLGLQAALDRLIEDQRLRFAGRLLAHIDPGISLEGDRALALYRMAQEGLTNVLKYAQASRIEIRLHRVGAYAELTVSDDGQGFDPAAVEPGHHGLAGMRDRLQAVRGHLEITSAPGAGTVLRARVPLPVAEGSTVRSGAVRLALVRRPSAAPLPARAAVARALQRPTLIHSASSTRPA